MFPLCSVPNRRNEQEGRGDSGVNSVTEKRTLKRSEDFRILASVDEDNQSLRETLVPA
jgi:hypothetical protein